VFKLSKLLQIEDELTDPAGLEECLGDRYLIAHNHIFAGIRGLFLSYGFQYSSADTELWRSYDTISLLALPEILETGTVPFKDNRSVLRKISAKNPGLVLSEGLFVDLVAHNHLMHESAHCISHHLLGGCARGAGSLQNQEYAMLCILCEAYANTVERLALASAKSRTHRLYFTVNSFVRPSDQVGTVLRGALDTFGLRTMLLAGMLAFCFLNIQPGPLSDEYCTTILKALAKCVRLSETEQVFMGVVINAAFRLNTRFSAETSPLYFQYLGCAEEFQELCKSFTARAVEDLLSKIELLADITTNAVRLDSPALAAAG
jgi:hypothetical protein